MPLLSNPGHPEFAFIVNYLEELSIQAYHITRINFRKKKPSSNICGIFIDYLDVKKIKIQA